MRNINDNAVQDRKLFNMKNYRTEYFGHEIFAIYCILTTLYHMRPFIINYTGDVVIIIEKYTMYMYMYMQQLTVVWGYDWASFVSQ